MLSGSRFIEHVGRWWYLYLPLVALGVFSNIGYMEWSKRSLSSDTRQEALERCSDAASPETCRQQVERFHEPCFGHAFTWRRDRAHVDRQDYSRCINHRPGKFR